MHDLEDRVQRLTMALEECQRREEEMRTDWAQQHGQLALLENQLVTY